MTPDEALASLVGALDADATPIAIVAVNADGSFALRALGAVRDKLSGILTHLAEQNYENMRAGSRVQ